jgi:Ca2+-binding RTX toxin-like protein
LFTRHVVCDQHNSTHFSSFGAIFLVLVVRKFRRKPGFKCVLEMLMDKHETQGREVNAVNTSAVEAILGQSIELAVLDNSAPVDVGASSLDDEKDREDEALLDDSDMASYPPGGPSGQSTASGWWDADIPNNTLWVGGGVSLAGLALSGGGGSSKSADIFSPAEDEAPVAAREPSSASDDGTPVASADPNSPSDDGAPVAPADPSSPSNDSTPVASADPNSSSDDGAPVASADPNSPSNDGTPVASGDPNQPPPIGYMLTKDTDIATDNNFYARLVMAEGSNTRINSLQTSDVLTGTSATDDILTVTVGSGGSIKPTLAAIEIVSATFESNAAALDFQSASGVKRINVVNSGSAVINNIGQNTNFTLQGSSITVNVNGVAEFINTHANVNTLADGEGTLSGKFGDSFYAAATRQFVVKVIGTGVAGAGLAVDVGNFDASQVHYTVRGVEGGSEITTGDGNDILTGGAAADKLYGGGGDDKLYGEAGLDIMYGDAGNDVLHGGEGVDELYGGAGNDDLDGGAGADFMYGGAGNDDLDGGAGVDTMDGGTGDDVMFGDFGADVIRGDAGHDRMSGGVGADVMTGGEGADSLAGGDGADNFLYNSVADSLTGSIDIITDFAEVGADLVMVNNVGVLGVATAAAFLGNFVNKATAEETLLTSDTVHKYLFVQDTHTLWVDANNNRRLDDGDLQIILNNITDLYEVNVGFY